MSKWPVKEVDILFLFFLFPRGVRDIVVEKMEKIFRRAIRSLINALPRHISGCLCSTHCILHTFELLNSNLSTVFEWSKYFMGTKLEPEPGAMPRPKCPCPSIIATCNRWTRKARNKRNNNYTLLATRSDVEVLATRRPREARTDQSQAVLTSIARRHPCGRNSWPVQPTLAQRTL
jgi:hypothetical protein